MSVRRLGCSGDSIPDPGPDPYLLEEREHGIPVPSSVNGTKPVAARHGPRVHVMARRAIEKHAVDGAAPAHHLASQDEGRRVLYVWDWLRLDDKVAGRRTNSAPGCQWGVEDAGCIFDVAVLDNEDRFCRGS